ncbi:hypothetical protein GCM10011338_12590 [Alteromonas lipolytica]|nr:hypothetical protein GCM10011338_12590 [Alteromonas lipolytica]
MVTRLSKCCFKLDGRPEAITISPIALNLTISTAGWVAADVCEDMQQKQKEKPGG